MIWHSVVLSVPSGLRTREFILRPLRVTDAELDFDALTASREALLVFSGGCWPTGDFSLTDNVADLKRHEREHHEGSAFTFTVMNPQETRCLGSVYIHPLRFILRHLTEEWDELDWHGIHDSEPVAHFWVRPELENLDRRLLVILVDWLKHTWRFEHFSFLANTQQGRILELFEEARLQRRFFIQGADNSRTYVVYDRHS